MVNLGLHPQPDVMFKRVCRNGCNLLANVFVFLEVVDGARIACVDLLVQQAPHEISGWVKSEEIVGQRSFKITRSPTQIRQQEIGFLRWSSRIGYFPNEVQAHTDTLTCSAAELNAIFFCSQTFFSSKTEYIYEYRTDFVSYVGPLYIMRRCCRKVGFRPRRKSCPSCHVSLRPAWRNTPVMELARNIPSPARPRARTNLTLQIHPFYQEAHKRNTSKQRTT